MDVVNLSEFEKISDTGTLAVYFKKTGMTEGLVYNYDVVFGKCEGQPYHKIPLIRGLIFIDDTFYEIHEKYWNEKGYHLNINDLPKYRYYFGKIVLSELSLSSLSVTRIACMVEPFLGDIKQ